MKIIQPKTVSQVNKAIDNENTTVFYRTNTMTFILNPFGGGINKTQEFELRTDWKVTKDKLKDITIIVH